MKLDPQKWIGDLTPWLFRFVQDSKTGQPSVKRYGLALTITVLCGIVFGMGIVIAIVVLNSQPSEQVEIVKISCSTLENISFIVGVLASGNYLIDKANARKAVKDDPAN
jgi:Na+/H+ antiporter NhaA